MKEELWFTPEAITFEHDQTFFLMKYYHHIKEGNWPDPKGRFYRGRFLDVFDNGYDLLSGRDTVNANSVGLRSSPPVPDHLADKVYYREKILTLFNELEDGLNRCSEKDLLIERYANDVRIETLCGMFQIKQQQVYHKCQLAIKYLAGRNPKKITYKEWLRNKGG